MRSHMICLAVLSWASSVAADPSHAERNPTKATTRLLEHIADDSWPLERFVDKKLGLIHIVVFGGENEHPPPPVAERLCGAALDNQLVSIKSALRQQLRASAEDNNVSCGAQKCTFNVRSEGASANTLWFRLDAEGRLYLEAYTQAPKLEWAPSAKQHSRFIATRLKALRATPCPKGSD